MIQAQQSNL